MSLEIETMDSDGTSYQWIGFDDWNVYKLNTCDADRWSEILEKLENDELLVEDVDGTDLGKLVNALMPNADLKANCSSLLSGLLEVSSEINDSFYCYYEDEAAQFFTSIEDLKAVVQEAYPANSMWEDMSTDELRGWVERYETEGDAFPVIVFEAE